MALRRPRHCLVRSAMAPHLPILSPLYPNARAMSVVTRFAPSPTGYLHIGGARTALFNRSDEHTSELQSLMRISSAVFCVTTQTLTNNSSTLCNTTPHIINIIILTLHL